MDERVRRTVDTYERVAETYEDCHDDRSVVAGLVEQFVTAVDERTGGATGSAASGPGVHDRSPRVLDVGCGPGWESATFADHGLDVVSFDLTRSFLDRARDRVPAAAPVRGDMREFPFADNCFDGLWACASLLHVPEADVEPTLSEFHRVLDGGVALVSLKRSDVAAPGVEESPYDGDDRHFERYRPAEIRDLFEECGFDVRDVATDGGWLAVLATADDRVPGRSP